MGELLRRRDFRQADALGAAQILLERKKITQAQFDKAYELNESWGSDVGHVLIGLGYARLVDFHAALAEHLGLAFVDLTTSGCSGDLIEVDARETYSERRVLPWRRDGGQVILAAARLTPPLRAWANLRYGKGGHRFVITSPNDIDWELQRLFRDHDSLNASEGLWRRRPQFSAKQVIVWPQVIALYIVLSVGLVGLWIAPLTTLIAMNLTVMLLYLGTFILKFVLTWVGSSYRMDIQVTDVEVASIPYAELPVYTVIVPLFREANVLPVLARALRRLDYPSSKLDLKLVVEESDQETIDTAKSLGLEGIFQIISVPHSQPQTKPKACNYALAYARGDLLTIYDAEDQPEPDQLRKVVAAFKKSSPDVACIQARLNYFNYNENFLTRMFTLEYCHWFDFMLPGLQALGIPIPLGGTSNHFRTGVLREQGGWDPHNVTEDADLGVRLEQSGYRIRIVNSTTYEEANSQLRNWLRQRSRWIKGYMQTYLVHMRDPIWLWRSVGPIGFFGFQFFVGMAPLTLLISPILWTLFATWLIADPVWLEAVFPPTVLGIALFNLLMANLLYIYFGVVSAFKRRLYNLALFGLLQPIYWVLHSWSAYIALYQLFHKPHFWEKTEHGISADSRKLFEEAMDERTD